MGSSSSAPPKKTQAQAQANTSVKTANTKKMIPDNYQTMEELQQGLRDAGLESSNLVLGIDYTKSNTWTGTHSFGGQCLHAINPAVNNYNPYQKVISIIGRTLEPFDDDHLIPVYGFGDISTTNKSVFSFMANDAPCNGFGHVLQRYNEITPAVQMSGPTNFAPLIYKTIDIVKRTQAYHILVIIADGQVDNEKATKTAIEEASKYPISIICVGVGDGPFDKMETFDDDIGNSKFDNFNFVNFNTVIGPRVENPEITFSVAALQEVPIQYMCCKNLGYF
ncbi:copine-2, putative [Entamoeba invadens IP1]|uniref:Copine-2, putative n=2 Tax=Entamoeba invadens TaxID=33085 RepID=A0A0A1U1M5_ENTIV|nr:copine-2, putative [Entamoeba invadens IP1]ELP87925.1 copine-2, putative [Entamoeba invadens IP1]BAN41419.1 copine-2, putative [Entamoeba invadens]|eukprot:XP_004254696.1 copine-2, putative [Entamoeba invadens IP1]